MSNPIDNPPAFPQPIVLNQSGEIATCQSQYDTGLSLRDYFAAKAMVGLISNKQCSDLADSACERGSTRAGYFASQAYQFADAMLLERSKTK